MGVREWVEEKYDNVKERVTRPVRDYSDRRERESRDSANREFRERQRITRGKVMRGDVSQERADQWMDRADRKRQKRSVPVERRAARGAARAIVGTADRVYNPGGSPTRDVWGVQGFVDKPRYAERISRGATRGYSMLYGTSKSYHEASRQFKSQRSPRQFGSFAVTGSHTGKSKASGWGILYGSRGSRASSGGGRRGSRKGSRDNADSDPAGWLL